MVKLKRNLNWVQCYIIICIYNLRKYSGLINIVESATTDVVVLTVLKLIP